MLPRGVFRLQSGLVVYGSRYSRVGTYRVGTFLGGRVGCVQKDAPPRRLRVAGR